MTYMTSKTTRAAFTAFGLSVVGLTAIGTIAIAVPTLAGHDDDIAPGNGTEYSNYPGPGLSQMYRRIDSARYDASVLDREFFDALVFYGPDSPVARTFRATIPMINWYANGYAREWIARNEHDAYERFIAINSVRVFFDIEGASGEAAHSARHFAAQRLPEYARPARSAHNADVVVRVRFRLSEPEIGVAKVSQKRKKYKKKIRKNPNPNARLVYATYNKVHERVRMQMTYRVKVLDGRHVLYSNRNALNFRDTFHFGTDFRAYGPAAGPGGWTTQAPYPSKKVRKLATRNIEASRARTVHKLENQAARALAQEVAGIYIPLRSELAPRYRQYSYNGR